QYYNFVRLGRNGYKNIISNCRNIAIFFSDLLKKSEYFDVISDVHHGLPLIAFKLSDKFKMKNHPYFNEIDISENLLKHGWQVPAYRLPEDCHDTLIMRVVIREIHNEDIISKLYNDIIWSTEN